MNDVEKIKMGILTRLSTVIDPETGVDVLRMRLIENLVVSDRGHASYTFRPSSPFCPLAVILAQSIKKAVDQVSGVTGQTITVKDFLQAEELTQMLNAAP